MSRIGKKIKAAGPERGRRVFVALSGGVDSSVSLYLLKKAGYDVTAAFIKIGECAPDLDGKMATEECWIGERREAMRVAAALDVPFITFDFDKEYEKEVLNYIFREYKAGRTPNPDVMCNRKIKFPLFWKKAKTLGADFMATGHYARISPCYPEQSGAKPPPKADPPRARKDLKLLAGADKEKDQSYFLYNLRQKDLEHILFPIGNLTKKEVRGIAKKAGLPTAEKKDSQGLCFLGQLSIRELLKTKIKPAAGKVVDANGNILGTHEGLAYYTIGQRHGIGMVGANKPYFAVEKDFKNNRLIAAPEGEEKKYFKKSAKLEDVNWISLDLKFPLKCKARVRYRAPLVDCAVLQSGKTIEVKFLRPERAITPGQSIVFYRDDEVLGGGIIK